MTGQPALDQALAKEPAKNAVNGVAGEAEDRAQLPDRRPAAVVDPEILDREQHAFLAPGKAGGNGRGPVKRCVCAARRSFGKRDLP